MTMTTNAELKPLRGKVAFVTGAGRGIGRAIALAYADAGAAVCVAARTFEQVRDTTEAIAARRGVALALVVDVTDEASIADGVRACAAKFGGIDVLVANAGVSVRHATVDRIDPADWARSIAVNLTGVFLCVRAIVPEMVKRGGGHIVMIGSGNGRRAARGGAAYAASKAGAGMLTRVFAQDLADRAIVVNELIPGPVETELLGEKRAASLRSDNVEWVKRPEDVAPLALLLATLPLHGPTGQSFSLCRREI
jgi:3-oxoacyl-[acyl-carrier protein] reductase